MSQQHQEQTEEWTAVRTRIEQIADQTASSGPEEPVNFRTVLDRAYEVSNGAPAAVLTGMVAVMPSPNDGETRGEYAARLREAVAR
ncbi:hypothetical protein ACKI16_29625 [Streptomyces scabiei]|uniref:hypothetical protein n=1 Tax=Streptomyces scabiei TaxID=1930 RepID=UPI0038F78EC3